MPVFSGHLRRYVLGSYRHSLAPRHIRSTMALPGNSF